MLKHLYEKYKDIIPYVFFGVCTTLVNIAAYWFCAHLLRLAIVPSTIVAWFIAVLFAYITNRKWVFHSESSTRKEIQRELVYFYMCRLGTGIVDWLCMYVFVDLLHLNDLVIKVGTNLLVIALNYIASKLLVFKKRK